MIPHKEYLEKLCDDLNYLFKESGGDIDDGHKFRLDVLILHLHMDNVLTEIIKNKFGERMSSGQNKKAFNMGGKDFMEKLRIVYATGDFDEGFFNAFRIVNKVRNNLAHNLVVNLDSEEGKIKTLKILKSFRELPNNGSITIKERLIFGSIHYLNSSVEYLYKNILEERLEHRVQITVNVEFMAKMPRAGAKSGTLEPTGSLKPIFQVGKIQPDMATKEQEETLKKLSKEKTPLFPLDIIESKINLLMMDIKVLNKNTADFSKEFIDEIKRLNTNVGSHLLFYVLQDIQDFYRQASVRFGEKIPFPKDVEIVRDLRDTATAHMKAKSPSEITDLCMKIEDVGGFERMHSQWVEYKNKLYREIREGRLELK
ncbi:MAG: hypothetical protein V1491_02035 [archaeon]